jgi:hypothetical protein
MTTIIDNKTVSKRPYTLLLSREELEHIRDLMGIVLEKDGQTISSMLARVENRVEIEEYLWENVYELCMACDISTEGSAPDFVLGLPEYPDIIIKKFEENGERVD